MTEDDSSQTSRLPTAPSLDLLPFEIQLRILSYTDVGARGPYEIEYRSKYIEHVPKVPSSWTTLAPVPDRRRNLNVLLVNHALYRAAFDVLYRESHFVLRPAYQHTIKFMRHLPPMGLRTLRLLRLRASIADADLIINNTWKNGKGRRWIEVADIIRQRCDVGRLHIEVDLNMVKSFFEAGNDPEKGRRKAYQFYMFITSTLSKIGGLKKVTFDLAWAVGLAPWMEREVLSGGCRSGIASPQPSVVDEAGHDELSQTPPWHRDSDSIRSFTF